MPEPKEHIEMLYRKYGTTTFHRVFRRLGDREAALDVTQDIFKNLLHVADRLEDSERSHRYLFRTTTNAIYRFLAQKRRLHELSQSFLLHQETSNAAEDSYAMLSQRLAQIDINALQSMLSEEDWELLYYRYMEGLSTVHMADIFEISDRAVRKRFQHLHQKLDSLQKKLSL